MRGTRRFSEAISEGDGISVIVEVADLDHAREAQAQGAEALLLRTPFAGLAGATTLPVLWAEAPERALGVAVDACLLVAEQHEREGELERVYGQAVDAGLDPVVVVTSEEELERVLDAVDPEILLLAGGELEESLEHVLDLLPDVPAGKLAIAALAAPSRDQVVTLERAGVDAVLVDRADGVAELVGGHPPEV